MRKLNVTLYGTSPLIMHSPKCVNPLHPIAIKMKEYTSKRKKTEEDLRIISDLEWEAGVYWDDSMGLYIPNECLAATIKSGAKFNKRGADIDRYVHIVNSMYPLNIGEIQDYDKMRVDDRFRDVRSVVVQRARVIRTRPRFNTWSVSFDLLYEENKIDLQTLVTSLENAGGYVGLCEMRTMGYGRFNATVEEIE